MRTALEADGIEVASLRLEGSAASHCLNKASVPEYLDLDLVFHLAPATTRSQLENIRAVLARLLAGHLGMLTDPGAGYTTYVGDHIIYTLVQKQCVPPFAGFCCATLRHAALRRFPTLPVPIPPLMLPRPIPRGAPDLVCSSARCSRRHTRTRVNLPHPHAALPRSVPPPPFSDAALPPTPLRPPPTAPSLQIHLAPRTARRGPRRRRVGHVLAQGRLPGHL